MCLNISVTQDILETHRVYAAVWREPGRTNYCGAGGCHFSASNALCTNTCCWLWHTHTHTHTHRHRHTPLQVSRQAGREGLKQHNTSADSQWLQLIKCHTHKWKCTDRQSGRTCIHVHAHTHLQYLHPSPSLTPHLFHHRRTKKDKKLCESSFFGARSSLIPAQGFSQWRGEGGGRREEVSRVRASLRCSHPRSRALIGVLVAKVLLSAGAHRGVKRPEGELFCSDLTCFVLNRFQHFLILACFFCYEAELLPNVSDKRGLDSEAS